MRKYWVLFNITIKEYFVYRLNFVLWRFRVVLNILLPLFLWTSVFEKQSIIGNYDKTLFTSYLLYGNLVATFAFGTRTFDISSDINDGKIINYLLKPVSFYTYHFAKELADKSVNLFFAFFEVVFLILIFKLNLTAPANLPIFMLFFINSVLISYFINLSLSFLGFWTTEVWPIRFIFSILLFFVAGSYFPLDILPKSVYNFILITPFPYMFYLPTRILIGNLPIQQYGNLLILSYFWLFGSYFLSRSIWKSGIKNFSFWGR